MRKLIVAEVIVIGLLMLMMSLTLPSVFRELDQQPHRFARLARPQAWEMGGWGWYAEDYYLLAWTLIYVVAALVAGAVLGAIYNKWKEKK